MEVTLKDGSRVRIRPIEPGDRTALAEGFERLSPESRYRRFFSPVPKLRERDLDYLTRIDHHRHEALVAVDPVTGNGVGVARFVRTEPGVAEPAIVVADDWQGRGVASQLLRALARRAREEGIERFDAPVLASNRDAIAVFERLGETTHHHAGREVELRIVLEDDEVVPVGPQAFLRAFAEEVISPVRGLLDQLLMRRRGDPGDERRNEIVVGTTGAPDASDAVEAAAALAGASDAVVHVAAAHVLLLPEGEALAAAVASKARVLRERGLHVHEHVRRGDPAFVLADIAEEVHARLIVVGAGGRTGTVRRLLGSTADTLVQIAPCDVLIVRGAPPA
jgi:nucleotide-binding universal stress UspA family protein